MTMFFLFFFSSRRRHTRCALVTGVQTCALPISVAALLAARLSGRALPAFPAPVPTTLAEAYDVQRRLTAALGAPVLGWKVGRVPPALVETLDRKSVV